MKDVYMDNDDIYQLFIKYNLPGVRKEVGRLALGVNMGDAGVINEALQARYDPSAGQRALQDASPVLLASIIPVNASEGEDAEDAEDAERAEPQPLEQQAENCIAVRDTEPQARTPPNAEQQQLAIQDAEPRGPAEMPQQLRNLEVEIQVEERRTNFKRKQYDLDLEQGACRKCPEWRAAHEWNIKYSAAQLELEDKKFALEQKRLYAEQKKLDARLEFKTKEFELRKKQEEWEIERKERMAAADKRIKEAA